MTMLVLAGGFGTRIRSLYPNTPKPMIPVAGHPFLASLLASYAAQGIDRFIILSGHLGDKLKFELSRYAFRASVEYVRETSPLGTAGAVYRCAATFDTGDVFMVSNGDSIYPGSIVSHEHLLGDNEAVIFGVSVPDSSTFGSMIVARDGRLVSFREKQPGAGIVNGGVYAFHRRFLKRFPETTPLSLEREVFPTALKGGAAIHVARTATAFLDIGTPESLATSAAFFQAHPVPGEIRTC